MKLSTQKITGIYRIINKSNGKSYVGKSFDIYSRWRRHFTSHKNPREKNLVFSRALNKYGIENFDWTIILILGDKNDFLLSIMERFFIKEFDTLTTNGKGYNETPGGEGHPGKRSEEFCKKIKESWINRRKTSVSEETRRKQSESRRGKKLDTSSGKMSLAGKKRWESADIRLRTISTRKANALKNRGWGICVGVSDFDGFSLMYFTSVKEAAKFYKVSPDGFISALNKSTKATAPLGSFFSNVSIQKVPMIKVFENRPDLNTI